MKALLLLALYGATCVSAETKDTVKVWMGTIELPTYQEGLPDLNPPFDEYATDRFNYPYTLRTELTGEKRLTTWRALFLENEYLRCTILPDIGGHLYNCVDKINGSSMFYDNSAIKKAKIGYRGAWAAFGVEFNFPVSHNWASMSPVDYSSKSNPDGSASVTIGNTDRVYGMQWVVELVLRPGESVLEEDIRLANLSDVRRRYYWWNNAAIRVWDDSRIDYPMRYTASHGFTEISPWPMSSDGKDLRVIANQLDGPVSRFVYGSREPYMGVWNPRTRSGTAHFSEYAELPGKKIWSWGSDAEGQSWRKALSDDDSAYVEVQGGLYRNQETYAFLEPAHTLHFHEYWMPVRETGGITRANRNGVLYMYRDAGVLHVALNVNHSSPMSVLTLKAKDKVLWQATANLNPENTWKKEIKLASENTPVHFIWSSPSGPVEMEHTESQFDWDQPQDVQLGPQGQWTVPPKDKRSVDDWLREGRRQELFGRTLLALDTYKQGEKQFPAALTLKLAIARVLVSLSRFDEARPRLEECAADDTANASVAYLLGLAREGTGDVRDALSAYETAFRQSDLRAAAALKLGELHAQLKDGRALTFLKMAAGASPDHQSIAEELAIAEERDPEERARLATRFPLSHVLQELAGKPDLIRLAADPYLTLQTAGSFMRLAHWEEAFSILTREYPEIPDQQKEPGYVLPQRHPLVLYAAALCAEKLGKSPEPYLARAQTAAATWVFPSTRQDDLSLKFALSRNQNNAQAHGLLGMLVFSRGDVPQAMDEWRKAIALDASLPAVGAQLGKAQLLLVGDASGAVHTLQDALVHDSRNPSIYETMDQAMSLLRKPPERRLHELERYPDLSKISAPLFYQLVLTMAEAGEFDRADQLFQGRFFPSEEGGVSAGQVKFEIALTRAEHAAREGKCDVVPDASEQEGILNGFHGQTLWRLAEIAESCGRHDEAVCLWEQVRTLSGPADLVWAHRSAKRLPGYDERQWRSRLKAGLRSAQKTWEMTAYRGWWQFQIALLYGELGDLAQRDAALQETFKLPESLMSHHLARLSLIEGK